MGLCINVCIPSLMHLFIYPSIQQFFFYMFSCSIYRRAENWGNFRKCMKKKKSLLISLLQNSHCQHFGLITSNFLSYKYDYFL